MNEDLDDSSQKPVLRHDLRLFGARVDAEFNKFRTAVIHGFDQASRRFDSVDALFDSVDARLDSVDTQLESVDTRLYPMDVKMGVFEKQFESTDCSLSVFTLDLMISYHIETAMALRRFWASWQ